MGTSIGKRLLALTPTPRVEINGRPSAELAEKRLAVTIIGDLALAGETGVQRDVLRDRYWAPSTPADFGRTLQRTLRRSANAQVGGDLGRPDEPDPSGQALSSMLVTIRKTLGEDVIRGVTTLSLNPEVLSSDVADFRGACAAGDYERAVELYGGPFLGRWKLRPRKNVLNEVVEHWIEEQAVTCKDEYVGALDALIRRDSKVGNPAQAAEWWKRRVAVERDDPDSWIGCLRALAAAGRRKDAIRMRQIYVELCDRDHDEPDPSVLAVAFKIESDHANEGREGRTVVAGTHVSDTLPISAPTRTEAMLVDTGSADASPTGAPSAPLIAPAHGPVDAASGGQALRVPAWRGHRMPTLDSALRMGLAAGVSLLLSAGAWAPRLKVVELSAAEVADLRMQAAVLYTQGRQTFEQGQYPAAERQLRGAVAEYAKMPSPNGNDFGSANYYLGRAQFAQHHYAPAESSFERAVPLLQSAAHPDPESVGSAYNFWGRALLEQCKFAPAEKALRRAREILVGAEGPNGVGVQQVDLQLLRLSTKQRARGAARTC